MTRTEAPASLPRTEGAVDVLRAATVQAHHRLETELDIDAAIADPDRMRALLGRFWGFHRIWEPAVCHALSDEAFTAPRRKLLLLEEDLGALGLGPADILALPLCHDAAPPPGRVSAMGSFYVLEGSTLGGRVITRRLKDAGWSRGLRYFDPYGEETGAAWRAFRARAETCGDAEAMAASALRTFECLRRWLTRKDAP